MSTASRSHRRRSPSRLVVATASCAVVLFSLAACSGTSGGPGDAETRTLRVASFAGPGAADTVASEAWADLVTEYTGGELEFEFFLSGSLLEATEILGGAGSGTVDLGVTSHGYYPSEMPLSHVLNLGFVSGNSAALADTMRSLYENNELYHAEWEQNGVRPLIFGVQSSTILGCSEPVGTIEDLRGKNVRAAALITEDFTSLGSNVVGIQAPEVLESLDRGVLDCWSALPLDLASDVGAATQTPYLYDYGRGSNGALELMIGTGVWDSLAESQQEAMMRASDEIAEEFITMLDERVGAACDAIEEAGGTLELFPSDQVDDWREVAAPANESRFLDIAGPDGEEFLDQYKQELEKFEGEHSDFVSPTAQCAERFQ